MSESRLICIIGPDGAGKSTQADMLLELLSNHGHDCEYRWLGFNHYLSLPLLGVARLIGLSEIETLDSGREVGYHHFERSKILTKLYPVLLLVDTLLAYLIAVAWPRSQLGKSLVCDRFIHDTVVNIMLSIDQPDFIDTAVCNLFFRLIPDDAEVFVLLADEDTLRDRRDDVEADRNISEKIQYYQILADRLDLPVIDSSKSPESIHHEIQAQLRREH
ncbi:thymidylate kinase [Haloparvum alkalitolerans]|uniref:hypothetical protein n=1 Tax=Haloparvum alkalitolerans TaxID=1042953 RepID=UPI003CE8101C